MTEDDWEFSCSLPLRPWFWSKEIHEGGVLQHLRSWVLPPEKRFKILCVDLEPAAAKNARRTVRWVERRARCCLNLVHAPGSRLAVTVQEDGGLRLLRSLDAVCFFATSANSNLMTN